jgi:hypothetical protein
MTNSDRTTDAGQGSKLDRRRDKSQSAKATAAAAQQRLDGVDSQLAANAAQTQDHEGALRRASDEVKKRKKALKTSAKQHQRLTASRKKAATSVAKAHQKTYAAENKYDKAVLADLVRKERDKDLAAHHGGAAQPASTGSEPSADAKPSAGPSPERPVAATATNTAARKTAASAANPTNKGSDTQH